MSGGGNYDFYETDKLDPMGVKYDKSIFTDDFSPSYKESIPNNDEFLDGSFIVLENMKYPTGAIENAYIKPKFLYLKYKALAFTEQAQCNHLEKFNMNILKYRLSNKIINEKLEDLNLPRIEKSSPSTSTSTD